MTVSPRDPPRRARLNVWPVPRALVFVGAAVGLATAVLFAVVGGWANRTHEAERLARHAEHREHLKALDSRADMIRAFRDDPVATSGTITSDGPRFMLGPSGSLDAPSETREVGTKHEYEFWVREVRYTGTAHDFRDPELVRIHRDLWRWTGEERRATIASALAELDSTHPLAWQFRPPGKSDPPVEVATRHGRHFLIDAVRNGRGRSSPDPPTDAQVAGAIASLLRPPDDVIPVFYCPSDPNLNIGGVSSDRLRKQLDQRLARFVHDRSAAEANFDVGAGFRLDVVILRGASALAACVTAAAVLGYLAVARRRLRVLWLARNGTLVRGIITGREQTAVVGAVRVTYSYPVPGGRCVGRVVLTEGELPPDGELEILYAPDRPERHRVAVRMCDVRFEHSEATGRC